MYHFALRHVDGQADSEDVWRHFKAGNVCGVTYSMVAVYDEHWISQGVSVAPVSAARQCGDLGLPPWAAPKVDSVNR